MSDWPPRLVAALVATVGVLCAVALLRSCEPVPLAPESAPGQVGAVGSAERVAVQIGPRTLVTEGPFPLRMSGGELRVGPAVLRGEASRFETELAVDVDAGTLDGRLDGTVDLSVVGAFLRGLRASGTATAALEIGGTLQAPRLEGRVDVDGARLRALGFPQPIEDLRALLAFEGDVVRLESGSAQMGGGQILDSQNMNSSSKN